MTYKIKNSKKLPKGYWEEREMQNLRRKTKGKRPSFTQTTREGTRRTLHINERIHKKGHVVIYKEGFAKVKKVSRKGLWIETWHKPTDKSIGYPSGKVIFVPEKRVEKEIYPIGSKVPIYTNPFVYLKD